MEVFEKMIEEDGFIEHANVHGKMYGTAVKELDRIKGEKSIPLLDIDVQGAQSVHNRNIDSVYIFVLPTDSEDIDKIKEVLKSRLEGRGTENEEQINKRLTGAVSEVEAYKNASFFNYTIVNDDIEVSHFV